MLCREIITHAGTHERVRFDNAVLPCSNGPNPKLRNNRAWKNAGWKIILYFFSFFSFCYFCNYRETCNYRDNHEHRKRVTFHRFSDLVVNIVVTFIQWPFVRRPVCNRSCSLFCKFMYNYWRHVLHNNDVSPEMDNKNDQNTSNDHHIMYSDL